jgi:endonuclease-3
MALNEAIKLLRSAHGQPEKPLADPWHLVLWENVCYLGDDDRRKSAFALLKKRTGLNPTKILSASDDLLLEVAKHGIMAESRVPKLRKCAEIVLKEFDGDLKQVLDWTTSKATKALQKFPGIAGPGAEKILLCCRRQAVLALESNGLRVLLRLGFGQDIGDYAKTYRTVREDIAAEAGNDYDELIAAHLLLRRHGQEVCKATKPKCGECVLMEQCPSAERAPPG